MGLKEIIDAVSALGTLGFAILAVYAFLKEIIVPRGRLDDQKAATAEALGLARSAIADNERLAAAVEARNRLEEARELAIREAQDANRRRAR
jgi:hypothetical protein